MFQFFDEVARISHPLTGLIKQIGRGDECDIIVADDTSVSRNHARLDRDGDDWVLVDLGSTNGTFVNGKRISEAKLSAGDVVEIGDRKMRFIPIVASERDVQKRTTNVSVRQAQLKGRRSTDPTSVFSRMKTAFSGDEGKDDPEKGESS